MATKIWIAGPRAFENGKLILSLVRKLEARYGREDLLVIEGEAPGVDRLVREACKQLGIHHAGVPALWDAYHRVAGPYRNRWCARLEPILLVAVYYHETLEEHRGTFSAVTTAHEFKIPVKLVKVPLQRALPSVESPSAPTGAKARSVNGLLPKPPKRHKKRS